MTRTQVQLTEPQLSALRQLAARRGLSISALVRQGVEHVLKDAERSIHEGRTQRALSAAGCFRSGRNDVARRHDEWLTAAYDARDE